MPMRLAGAGARDFCTNASFELSWDSYPYESPTPMGWLRLSDSDSRAPQDCSNYGTPLPLHKTYCLTSSHAV